MSSDASVPAAAAVGEVSVVVSVKPDATQRSQPLPLLGLPTCADLALFLPDREHGGNVFLCRATGGCDLC